MNMDLNKNITYNSDAAGSTIIIGLLREQQFTTTAETFQHEILSELKIKT